MAWIYLAVAIVSEVIGTVALKASDGFSQSGASTVCIVAYAITFYALSLVVKSIPLGVAYAIWAGAGIVLITAAGAVWYKQLPDAPALVGMAFIITGVVIINVFSKTVAH